MNLHQLTLDQKCELAVHEFNAEGRLDHILTPNEVYELLSNHLMHLYQSGKLETKQLSREDKAVMLKLESQLIIARMDKNKDTPADHTRLDQIEAELITLLSQSSNPVIKQHFKK